MSSREREQKLFPTAEIVCVQREHATYSLQALWMAWQCPLAAAGTAKEDDTQIIVLHFLQICTKVDMKDHLILP